MYSQESDLTQVLSSEVVLRIEGSPHNKVTQI